MVPDTKDIPVPSYSHRFAAQLKAAAPNPAAFRIIETLAFPQFQGLGRRTILFGGGRRSHLAAVLEAAGRFCERRLYGTSSIFPVRRARRSGATSRAARFYS